MENEEIWRDIKGYEGTYQVSNWGRVRSIDREVVFKGGSKRWIKGKILKKTKRRLRIPSHYFTI